MGDTTLTASSDDVDEDAEAITKIGVSTKMDAITLSYSAASTGAAGSSVGDDWDASVSYSAGALTASFAVDEDDVTKLSASYDLGGGAKLVRGNEIRCSQRRYRRLPSNWYQLRILIT